MTDLPPPQEIKPFVDLIGIEGTVLILEHYAGQRIYIPRDPAELSEMAKAVGLEIAQALASAYGGIYIILPFARKWRALIYKKRGLSYREMAKRLGCRENYIHRVLQQNGATQAQLSLF